MHSLGRALIAYRKTTGASVADLAGQLNVGLSTIVDLEAGASWPSIKTLRACALFLHWDAKEIGAFVLSAKHAVSQGAKKRFNPEKSRELRS